MPGYRYSEPLARCPECNGADLGAVGFPIHKPICSTQPGYEAALQAEAEAKAERRRQIAELIADPETQRRLKLRQATRLP